MGLNRLSIVKRVNVTSDDDFVAYIKRSIVALENSGIDTVGDNALKAY